jgi:thiosulfate dehydrogenase [quinone] large subunit
MVGLAAQPAALAAAGLLSVFYFAAPPWPGLPVAAGEGHYLFVDRNLLEALMCIVLATVPSGVWAGLDSWAARWLAAWKTGAARETAYAPAREEVLQ